MNVCRVVTTRVVTAAAALVLVAAVVVAIPSFFDAEFEVVNRSSQAVFVIAAWRSSNKDLGTIAPMSSHRFSLSDEAAIQFTVRYPGGTVVESKALYFSAGTKVVATISSNGIAVHYDF